MPYNRREVCTKPDGTFLDVLAAPGVISIRAVVDSAGNEWRIETTDAPDAYLYRNGVAWHRYEGAFGFGFTLLRLDESGQVQIYLQGGNVNDWTTVSVYHPDGTPVMVTGISLSGEPMAFPKTYQVPYSAEGLLYAQPYGTPVPDIGVTVIQNVGFYHATIDKGYTLGLADGGDSPAGCVALQKPDGTLWMHPVTVGIQLAPRLAVNDSGDFRVVYSGLDSPPMFGPEGFVPYRPYVPPVPQPDPLPPLPQVPSVMPRMWMGRDDTHVTEPGAGDCVWTPRAGDAKPWTEDYRFPPGVGPMLCGLFLTDGDTAAEDVDPQITYTQLKNAHAVFIHQDDYSAVQRLDAVRAAARVRSAGLTPIHSLHVVEGMHSADWMADALHGYTGNIQTVGRSNAQVRLDAIWLVEQCRQGKVDVCFWTRWFACEDAELREWLTQVMSKVPQPVLLPGQPLPVPPEPPKPQPPDPTPPKLGFWAKLALAIKLWGKGRGHRL